MRKTKFRLDFLDGHQAVTFEGYEENGEDELCLAVTGDDHTEAHLHLNQDKAEVFYEMLGAMLFTSDGKGTVLVDTEPFEVEAFEEVEPDE